MKLILALILIVVGITSACAGGLMLLKVGDSNGNGGAPVTPCDQTGLDFTLNCNMILIPALIR